MSDGPTATRKICCQLHDMASAHPHAQDNNRSHMRSHIGRGNLRSKMHFIGPKEGKEGDKSEEGGGVKPEEKEKTADSE